MLPRFLSGKKKNSTYNNNVFIRSLLVNDVLFFIILPPLNYIQQALKPERLHSEIALLKEKGLAIKSGTSSIIIVLFLYTSARNACLNSLIRLIIIYIQLKNSSDRNLIKCNM